jgi:hypothetical protein
MIHYERRLPHGDLVGQPLFVTILRQPARQSGISPAAMDRILEPAGNGPQYLDMPEIGGLSSAAQARTKACRTIHDFWAADSLMRRVSTS